MEGDSHRRPRTFSRPFDLKARPGSNRYSLQELLPNVERFEQEVNAAGKKDDKDRTLYEKHLILLGRKLDVMGKIAKRAETRCLPPSSYDPKSPTSEWMSPAEVDETVEAQVASELRAEMSAKGINLQNANAEQKAELLRRFKEMSQDYTRSLSPAYGDYMAILNAFEAGDADRFNKAVEDFRDRHLGFVSKSAVFQAEVEAFLNKLAPFYWSIGFYTLAAVLAALSWLPLRNPGTRRGLLRAALMLLAFTVMLHTGSLLLRIIVSGRPPVTNLYSSAVFIGWGAALLSLLLEFIYRNGFSTAVGGVIGALTMVISHHLSKEGDTLDVMQAVLDTNFWLATHVTCVTMGYAATYFAGFIGVGYIAARLLNMGKLPHDTEKMFSKMLYGMVCFCHAAELRRHGVRWHLGRRVVGPVLGMGSQGERGRPDRVVERADPPRPMGRAGADDGPVATRGVRQYDRHLVVVRHEPTRRRPARLRLLQHAGEGVYGGVGRVRGLHRPRVGGETVEAFARVGTDHPVRSPAQGPGVEAEVTPVRPRADVR